MGDDETAEIPKKWIKRAKQQGKRFNQLNPEERKEWGFTEDTPQAQAKSDEEKNPSS